MFQRFRLGRRTRASFGLMILSIVSTPTFAADNIWQATFGQSWFYEVRSWSGEILAGTWWESSLTPGNTYRVTFDVQTLRGKAALLVGDHPAIAIDHTGSYAYDFYVSDGGKRRLVFRTASSDVLASVNHISVTRQWADSSQSWSGGNWVPKGHYIALDRTRDLETDMLDLVTKPWTASSDYALNTARDLDGALKTPGVKGVWMRFFWRDLEVADGVYDWRVLDHNMAVARQYGLKFVVQVSDRSFDGSNILPRYFPSRYVLWQSGGGHSGVVSKRWDPWVYNRLIRLYKAIARRYADNAAFGGIATTETATGNFSGGDYSIWKYRTALTQIITQTEAALTRGRLYFYLNFLKGGDNSDMNQDVRVKLLAEVPHGNLVVGAPDVTPDAAGMPRSVTNYRIHARKTMPDLEQFCHLQHTDLGEGGVNVKTNRYRQAYYQEVANARQRESQSWFSGTPAAFEFDDLRDINGNRVKLHPSWELGRLWQPEELFTFGERNFGCDYVFWHYREHPNPGEFGWDDVRPVILDHQYFYSN